jgi:preprotein translocase subunit YajC
MKFALSLLIPAAIATAQAAPAAKEAPGIMNMLPMMVVMFVIFYFFIIRPQGKKQKEMQKMLEAVKKGDKVITIGGIIGLVVDVKGQVITLKISSTAEVDFKRSAISTIITPEVEADLKGEKKK